jgi:glyoxylase-like metal-dependent hydrolase (beta-lactamase superfamily II)/rhodanese-related sulfurtransferase
MTVDAETLRVWMETGTPLTVLDVRPDSERAEWCIPGSLHVDAYDALWAGDPAALDSVSLPVDRPVITVCAVGKTSLLAAEVLRSRGHTVFSLTGGMGAWSGAWNLADVPSGIPSIQIVQVRRTGKGCLSYVVGCDSEAAVIDPSVDLAAYLTIAETRGWKIVSVIETHAHADHLSRAVLLCRATGAVLSMPEQQRVSFPYAPIRDGQTLPLGSFGDLFTAIRTPGHTEEGTCYMLGNTALFTGDTLFLRGVGRPDLEGGMGGAESLGRALSRSLHSLLSLPGGTLVLPSHTPSPVGFDGVPLCAPLAQVIRENALLGLPEEEFVAAILARIPPTPPNFLSIMHFNESGSWPEGDPSGLESGSNRCAVG